MIILQHKSFDKDMDVSMRATNGARMKPRPPTGPKINAISLLTIDFWCPILLTVAINGYNPPAAIPNKKRKMDNSNANWLAYIFPALERLIPGMYSPANMLNNEDNISKKQQNCNTFLRPMTSVKMPKNN